MFTFFLKKCLKCFAAPEGVPGYWLVRLVDDKAHPCRAREVILAPVGGAWGQDADHLQYNFIETLGT